MSTLVNPMMRAIGMDVSRLPVCVVCQFDWLSFIRMNYTSAGEETRKSQKIE